MADYAITPDSVESRTQPITQRTTSAAVEKGDVVAYGTDDTAAPADATTLANANARGIAVSKAAAGSIVSIAENGAELGLGDVTGMTAGASVYVSPNAGKMSPEADVGSGQFPTLVGFVETGPTGVKFRVAISASPVAKA